MLASLGVHFSVNGLIVTLLTNFLMFLGTPIIGAGRGGGPKNVNDFPIQPCSPMKALFVGCASKSECLETNFYDLLSIGDPHGEKVWGIRVF